MPHSLPLPAFRQTRDHDEAYVVRICLYHTPSRPKDHSGILERCKNTSLRRNLPAAQEYSPAVHQLRLSASP